MLIAFNVFKVFDIWMVYVGQETEKLRSVNWFWGVCYIKGKVIHIDLNDTVPLKNVDISVVSIYKVWYMRVYLTWK